MAVKVPLLVNFTFLAGRKCVKTSRSDPGFHQVASLQLKNLHMNFSWILHGKLETCIYYLVYLRASYDLLKHVEILRCLVSEIPHFSVETTLFQKVLFVF